MHLAQEESPQRKSECIQLTDVGREEEAAETPGEGRKAGGGRREEGGGRRAKKRNPLYSPS